MSRRKVTEPPAMTSELTGAARGFTQALLTQIWQLNTLFLETLSQCSSHPAWPGSLWDTALGPDLNEMLPIVREDLSRSPVCLVHLGLSEENSRALLAGVGESCVHSPPAFLPRDRAIQLAQVSLTLAWTVARQDLVSTSIVFGVSQTQADLIGALAVQSIPPMSERLSGGVRPRMAEPAAHLVPPPGLLGTPSQFPPAADVCPDTATAIRRPVTCNICNAPITRFPTVARQSDAL